MYKIIMGIQFCSWFTKQLTFTLPGSLTRVFANNVIVFRWINLALKKVLKVSLTGSCDPHHHCVVQPQRYLSIAMTSHQCWRIMWSPVQVCSQIVLPSCPAVTVNPQSYHSVENILLWNQRRRTLSMEIFIQWVTRILCCSHMDFLERNFK